MVKLSDTSIVASWVGSGPESSGGHYRVSLHCPVVVPFRRHVTCVQPWLANTASRMLDVGPRCRVPLCAVWSEGVWLATRTRTFYVCSVLTVTQWWRGGQVVNVQQVNSVIGGWTEENSQTVPCLTEINVPSYNRETDTFMANISVLSY